MRSREQPDRPRPDSPAGPAGILAGSAYTVLVRSDGTGYTLADGIALTARTGPGDVGRDGLQFFVRDLDSGRSWTVGRADHSTPGGDPAGCRSVAGDGVFHLEHVQDGLRAVLEVCAVPDRAAELRCLTLTNLADRPRRLDVTSCAAVVLNDPAAHAAHPVFSKLFLQTSYRAEQRALLVQRRAREPHEIRPTLVHALLDDAEVSHTTDRARFQGRGRPWDRPAALNGCGPLDGRTGNVLDQVVSLRLPLTLAAGADASCRFLLGAADDAAAALALVAQLRGAAAVDAAFAAAQAHAAQTRTALGLTPQEGLLAQRLAFALLDGAPGLRAGTAIQARAAGSRTSLARHGIGPDGPLVVVHAADAPGRERAEAMVRLARWWQAAGLGIDLVVVGGPPSRAEAGLRHLVAADLSAAERDLLDASADLLLAGPLPAPELWWPAAPATPVAPADASPSPPAAAAEALLYDNGLGGFSADGREYVIHLRPDAEGNLILPPQPWTNVLANERLGCLVGETGAGCTWYGNSRENRLTPWSNDPVLDPHGETLHLRDDQTGAYFSCLPGPTPAGGAYEMRHGHGYSRCLRRAGGLEVETLLFVAREDPVRIARVRVTNRGERPRRLSLFSCCRLVLGATPARDARFVVSELDARTGALLATNREGGAFAGHPALAAVAGDAHVLAVHATADRRAFLGQDLDPARPAALARPRLDGRNEGPDVPAVGAGLDPCFAHQVRLAVPPGATAEVAFLLGQETDTARAQALVAKLTRPGGCAAAWQEARGFWRDGLDALRIETPSPALDLMVNGWLGYQTLACRIRGRTAFYQSGGAFGFRDQLQDALSLLPLWPQVARRQILLNAAHQFVEGDVLHWWHPPDSRGIRTRFADDLVWLPYLAAEYVAATGDAAILDEVVPFLEAAPLAPGADETFLKPAVSTESADLYEHCCRALDRAMTRGVHGLPLFGTGDWNDGMNRVGREGRGESVWMGFFLVAAVDRFLPCCEDRRDLERGALYRRYRDGMAAALNDTGWDGAWYRRGYYDDGSPLGSSRDGECRIDALAQAWSVLSGVAAPERAAQAMDAVEEHLISDREGLIRLLAPPFVDTPRDPGYIKGYVAGVRENGGQYTHAALWVVRAMAALGRRDRAAELLDLLNPVRHAATPEQVACYQVEPYVVAADVYGAPPHVGRGGWTWYTGSSGWMLRVALESILGLRTEGGDTLVLDPCVPDDWSGFKVDWRRPDGAGRWDIRVANPHRCSAAVVAVTVDGAPVPLADGVARIVMPRDGGEHRIEVELGPRAADPS